MLKQYETVIILNPVLSQDQVTETVEKFKKILTDTGSVIVFENNWGLRKLAYPIQKKNTGFYYLIEFKSDGANIGKLELEYKRDERLMRFLTVSLDKHAVIYNEKKRKNAALKKKEESESVSQN
ncbi:MAG: 30S ribosomal protein S6 [Bacteroidia bacterium]|jgi:small subunit ribosomal protein S6|nr:30S ribosomal protein S6 [Bacteroidota bacterium]MBL7913859.1 30S ribosomal protein S6 [Bacteroidia bacterium]OQA07587.1 MAG: 30S ribosomal protein S6 [Bacteroidetes bacterium ADurb.Bin397]MBK7391418.1 30S ribosomal protein S6 [Bacteroidota bacterium]MBK8413190.1 30S ribosomal protein S6 [Bacteroidota bacterium]